MAKNSIDVSDYTKARQATFDHLQDRHGELTQVGSSLYEAEDGYQCLITYANKNEQGLGWLALRHNAMKQLEHPQGFLAFAFIDQDMGKVFFLEVPMKALSQQIQALEMQPGLSGKRAL